MKRLLKIISESNKLPSDSQKTNLNTFVRGAFWGLLVFSLFMMGFAGFFFRTGLSPILQVAVYLLIGVLAFYLFRWLGTIIHLLVKKIPTVYASLVLATVFVFMLARYMRLSWPQSHIQPTLIPWILGVVLIGGGLVSLIKLKRNKPTFIGAIAAGLILLFIPLSSILWTETYNDDLGFEPKSAINLDELNVPNPGLDGAYEFEYFTYGSGSDERRPEYGSKVKYKTEAVDGSLMLPEWKGKKKKWRERYWGFGIDEAPINGRVWMPKKEGKLPLILVVHGNHGMEHYSDPGYAYLGELLASRGFITVSVDENYINGTWSGDFRGREMPIRAWLLLKHLEQWRNWSKDELSDFFGKVDLDNVVLMGHSRGGEAVSIAAAYNKLAYFPDNANVRFDFNFGIKGIVTIAPTDQRYFRRLDLQDLNYLSLQGSYDADEASFFGLRQYQRISYSDSTDFLKASLLIHRANHGQFNSIWGRRDFGEPFGWFLNTYPLISGEEQRQVAKVFIGAFAERIFNGETSYDHLFKNSANGASWLPNTAYLSNYQKSGDQILIDYEEDIDITTAGEAKVNTENLTVWREEALKMRGGETQGTNAVILGWDEDSLENRQSYSITFDLPVEVRSSQELIFSIGRASDKAIDMKDTTQIDFTINLITSDEDTISTKLADHKLLTPKLRVKYMKLDKMNGSFGGNWEIAMETVNIPVSHFSDQSHQIKTIEFLFDQSKKGLIALDKIGFRGL